MLPLLVIVALLSFGSALVLPWRIPLLPAAHVHLALAMGAMPLIFGAMLHFIPVLTRSGAPARALAFLPLAALGAGGMAVYAFVRGDLLSPWLHAAAGMGLLAAVLLAAWEVRRGKAMLGDPHSCLHWYVAALACLALALLAVAAMPWWPAERLALKRFHLHLNLLGFIGLTALGTAQVLLPTAAGRFDPQAAPRLRRGLPWAVAGVLLTAAGAAWWPPLAWLGLASWAGALFPLGRDWLVVYRKELFAWHGAVPSLGLAVLGFGLALAAGGAQAAGAAPSAGAAHLFVLGFLFPLVTGAAGQLLPLWLRPGRQTEWHDGARVRLTRWAGARGLLFLAGGLVTVAGGRWGFLLAMAGLLHFASAVVVVAVNRVCTK